MGRRKKPRCTTCGALRLGHDGPTGVNCRQTRVERWEEDSHHSGSRDGGTRGEGMAKSMAGVRPVDCVSVTGPEGDLLDGRRDEAENPVAATPPRAQSGDSLRGVDRPLDFPPWGTSRDDVHPARRPEDDVGGDPWVVLDRWHGTEDPSPATGIQGDSYARRVGRSNPPAQHFVPSAVVCSGPWTSTSTSCTWSGMRVVSPTVAPTAGHQHARAAMSGNGLHGLGGAIAGPPLVRPPYDDRGPIQHDIRGPPPPNSVYSSQPFPAAQGHNYFSSPPFPAAHGRAPSGSQSLPAARSDSLLTARPRVISYPDYTHERSHPFPATQAQAYHMSSQPFPAAFNYNYPCVNDVPHEEAVRGSGTVRPVYAPAPGMAANTDTLYQRNVRDISHPHVHFNVADGPHSIYDQHNGPKPSDSSVTSPLTAHINDRVVATALNGEFVELHECLDSRVEANNVFGSAIDGSGNVVFKSVKPKKYITSVLKWLEAWGYYEIVMGRAMGFGVIHEMACYRTFILNLFQRFKVAHVLSYDYKHRHKLGAYRSLDFARVNYDAYLECFDASALRNTNRCARCGSAEHDNNDCPFRPASASTENTNKRAARVSSSEICRMFQDGKCRFGKRCHRRHVCATCGGSEGYSSCPACQKSRVSTQ